MTVLQEKWFNKIKSWIPTWFYEDRKLETAYLKALAKILASAQIDMEDQAAMTFIDTSVAGFLELHGNERGIERNAGEFDPSYRIRIRNALTSNADKSSLKRLVDTILINGKCAIIEDFENDLFFNRSTFFNRGYIVAEKIVNTFSVVVDNQVHAPYSFMNRENFMNRSDFIGQQESSIDLFNLIVKILNDNKALGTFFRVIERAS